jgi:hypothetical protein
MQEITNSIFDVVLTVYFSEAFAFSNNKEVSSALVDALLFQSIGSEATPVISEEEFLGTTQNCRGIYKFYLGRQRFKI